MIAESQLKTNEVNRSMTMKKTKTGFSLPVSVIYVRSHFLYTSAKFIKAQKFILLNYTLHHPHPVSIVIYNL